MLPVSLTQSVHTDTDLNMGTSQAPSASPHVHSVVEGFGGANGFQKEEVLVGRVWKIFSSLIAHPAVVVNASYIADA